MYVSKRLVDDYLTWQRKNGIKEVAITRRAFGLNKYLRFSKRQFTRVNVQKFVDQEIKSNLSTHTILNYFFSVYNFETFLDDQRIIKRKFMDRIRRPKHSRQPKVLPQEEIIKVVRQPQRGKWTKGPSNQMYNLLFTLLALTGVRLGEARGLRVGEVDIKRDIITLRGAKGRTVPLPKKVIRMINDWIVDRGLPVLGFVFHDYRRDPQGLKRLSPEAIELEFRKRLDVAGIDKSVTVRSLRTSFIVHMLQQDISIKKIMRLTGKVDFKHELELVKHSDEEVRKVVRESGVI